MISIDAVSQSSIPYDTGVLSWQIYTKFKPSFPDRCTELSLICDYENGYKNKMSTKVKIESPT